jgi:hypothetical protein
MGRIRSPTISFGCSFPDLPVSRPGEQSVDGDRFSQRSGIAVKSVPLLQEAKIT